MMRPTLRRFETMLARTGQLLVAYLASAVVETIVFSELRGGHADVPFTTFPEYLLLSPVLPAFIADDLVARHSKLTLVSTGVFVVCFLAAWLGYEKAVLRNPSRSERARSCSR